MYHCSTPHLDYTDPIPNTAKDSDLVKSVQRFASRVCLKSWNIRVHQHRMHITKQ